jgi:phosphoserine phosphatase RsbU/P
MDQLLEHAPCGYLSFKDDGTIVYVNETCCSWLGFTKDQLLGRSIETIFTVATKIFYNTHFFPLLKLEGHASEIYLTLRAQNTDDIPVLTNAVRRVDDGVYASHCVFIALHQRRKYEDEILQAKREAENALKESKHFQELSSSLEQRTMELDQLYQKQKVFHENLVQFSKIISHDLQEPLRKIELFTSEVLKVDQVGAKGTNALEKVLASAAKLRLLTKGLQQYVELEEKVVPVEIDLQEVINLAIQRASDHRQFSDFDVDMSVLPSIFGYRRQMELLFFHLVDNSIQFREPSRRLKISISSVSTDENIYKATKDKYRFQQHVRLYYADNGSGFENQYNKYVFDLLNKIDARSEGLGIGLSLIKKVVDNHSGTVEVSSEKHVGTRFTFIFPAGR